MNPDTMNGLILVAFCIVVMGLYMIKYGLKKFWRIFFK